MISRRNRSYKEQWKWNNNFCLANFKNVKLKSGEAENAKETRAFSALKKNVQIVDMYYVSSMSYFVRRFFLVIGIIHLNLTATAME